ncbi:MAG: M20 family metallopeptidase [Ktedonobacteraceae bacterium]|nr:M20 family metallopeptidase [Ktedonobacteraceae bacterium]MBO0789679.1 M20 family metallopeptidase [Ktedonobacteraceae bacterium]
MQNAVEQAGQLLEPFLADLQAIVNIDSGTYTKTGVDYVGAYLRDRFQNFGFSTSFERQQEYGDNLVAEHIGSVSTGPRILLIGHMDTVFPDGEAERRPFAVQERNNGQRIATGPGVLDMKSGLLIGMYGLHMLLTAQQANYQRVTCLFNSDEEIGSPASKPLIQEIARQSDAVIVLEPGRALTTVVSSRRASGQYRVEVRGVAAHAGVEPHLGRSAILELSHQVQAIQALNGTIPGTTFNVGVIHGGERTNIVPDFAYCEVDVRASDGAGVRAIDAAMRKVARKRMLEGTSISLSGGFLSQPFERNERNGRLVTLAKEAGRDLGIEIMDLGSGGASDANNTSGLDVATIDGLGAGGGLAHNPDEYIELGYLPERIALLSGLVRRIGDYYEAGNHL